MSEADSNQAALAAYIAAHSSRTVPDNILEAARLCLADWLAVAIGAGDEPAGRIVRETVSGWHSSGRASVLYGGAASAPMAALSTTQSSQPVRSTIQK